MPSVMDERIRRWQLELAVRYGLLRRELDELEDHVRREVAESLEGVDPPSDERVGRELDDAIDRLGDSRAIARELRKSRRGDFVWTLIGYGSLAVVIVLMLLMGGRMSIYLDIPFVVWIGCTVLAGVCVTCRPRRLVRAVAMGLLRSPPSGLDELVEAQGLLQFARVLCWASGLIGALIGTIAILSDLSYWPSIASGLALMLLAILYGGMLAEFFFAPMRQTVKARRDQVEAAAGLAAV